MKSEDPPGSGGMAWRPAPHQLAFHLASLRVAVGRAKEHKRNTKHSTWAQCHLECYVPRLVVLSFPQRPPTTSTALTDFWGKMTCLPGPLPPVSPTPHPAVSPQRSRPGSPPPPQLSALVAFAQPRFVLPSTLAFSSKDRERSCRVGLTPMAVTQT